MRPTTIILISCLVLFLQGNVFAVDLNSMSDEQILAYITSLEDKANAPTVITIQPDAELRSTLATLQQGMADLKNSNEKLKENFAKLVNDTEQNLKRSKDDTVAEVRIETQGIVDARFEEGKDFVRTMTNPLRIGLPMIAIFAMCTGAFLLWSNKINKGAP